MARVDVIMPQMGESIAEGTVSKWLKQVGDPIKRDEPILEISTDKVDAEIPAPQAGTLAEILVQVGQTVPVQAVVARIETDVAATIAAPAATAPASRSAAPAPAAPPARTPTRVPAGVGSGGGPVAQPPVAPPPSPTHTTNGQSLEDRLRTRSSPLVRKIAAEHRIELSSISGSGVAGRVTKKDILSFIESGGPSRPAVAGGPP